MPNYYGTITLQPGQVFRDSTIICDAPNSTALVLADGCRVENVTVKKMASGARKTWNGVGIFGAGAEMITVENVTVAGFGVGVMFDGTRSTEQTGRISIEKAFIDANTGVYIKQITDNLWLEKVHVHPLLGIIGDGASTNYLYSSGPAIHISDRAETVYIGDGHSYGHPQGILIDNPTPEYAPSVRVSGFNAESYPDPIAAAGMGLPANSAAVHVAGEAFCSIERLYMYGMESALISDFAINPWGCHVTVNNAKLGLVYGIAFDLRRGEGWIDSVFGDKYQGTNRVVRGAGAQFDLRNLKYVQA